MRIAFTHNLKQHDDVAEAEFDTPETIAALSGLLRELGHEVHPVDVTGPVSRLVARLETLRPDLVFNTAEGTHGRFREAFYPALFEQLRLPFTGADAYACALTLDKQATKLVVQRIGVPTPQWMAFDPEHPRGRRPVDLRFPVIVKPAFEGSSKGITAESVVADEAGLRARVAALLALYPEGVIAEEFIVGVDVTVPYLEAVGVLPPAAYRFAVEGVAPGHAIYDYTLKNDASDRVEVIAPAPLPPAVMERLQGLTGRIMSEMNVRDLGRADFRVTPEGEVYFIEVNALPSLEPGASMYLSAALAGLADPAAVLAAVVDSASRRYEITPRVSRPASALRLGLAHNVRRVDPRTGDDADAEFDAPQTIAAIGAAIAALGHEVVPIEASPELPRVLADLELDLVFNIAEGLRGRSREAQVPALLELLDIPYTGSDAAALAVTLDKGLAKRLVREAGIDTPAWRVVPPEAPCPTDLGFPVIVKPNAEGTSKGITGASVARDQAALEAAVARLHDRYGSAALIEAFLPGREFTVGLLGERDPTVLPIMEICFGASAESLPVYGYDHKAEDAGGVTFAVPAAIDDALADRIRAVARGSFEALGCRDVARVDIRLDGSGAPHFIECNPLPGLSPGFSDLCVIAEAAGLDHGALIAAILAPAQRRLARSRMPRPVGAKR